MRRWLWISGIIVVLVIAYWVWPLIGAAQLARAAQQGDSAQVIDRVDLPALRRSLAKQIGLAYLQATGKADKMGALGRSFAGAAVTTVADSYVADLLTPENIAALLSQGKVGRVKVGDRDVAIDRQLPGLSNVLNGNMLSLLTGSYFDGPASFVISAEDAQNQAYGIHLRLGGTTWRLSGIDLPHAIVDDMARSILAAEKPPS